MQEEAGLFPDNVTHPSKETTTKLEATTKLVLLAGGQEGGAWDLEAGLKQHPLPPGSCSPPQHPDPLSFLAGNPLLALKLLESWREAVSGGGRKRGIVFSESVQQRQVGHVLTCHLPKPP